MDGIDQSYSSRKVDSSLRAQQSQVSFTNKLEKHLDDYRHGYGDLPSSVSAEIQDRSVDSSRILANTRPSTNTLFLSYQTAFTYSARARFINGVSRADALSSFDANPNIRQSNLVEQAHARLLSLIA